MSRTLLARLLHSLQVCADLVGAIPVNPPMDTLKPLQSSIKKQPTHGRPQPPSSRRRRGRHPPGCHVQGHGQGQIHDPPRRHPLGRAVAPAFCSTEFVVQMGCPPFPIPPFRATGARSPHPPPWPHSVSCHHDPPRRHPLARTGAPAFVDLKNFWGCPPFIRFNPPRHAVKQLEQVVASSSLASHGVLTA